MPTYLCSNAFIGGALIAAAAILLPTILHAQQASPEVSPPPPGISWGSPPVPGEWETPTQGGATAGDAQEQHDEVTERRQEQVLIAQQAMAEQARRVADFMFWQIVVGVAVLIGLGVTIYYTRQIARAAINAVNPTRQAPLTHQPTGVQIRPAPVQHAAVNQQGKVER